MAYGEQLGFKIVEDPPMPMSSLVLCSEQGAYGSEAVGGC